MRDESEKSFERVRAEVEQKQKAILWEEARTGGRSVDEFLWKGDSKAKTVQRIGLVIFGLGFLLMAIAFASIPSQKHFEDGWIIEYLFAAATFLVALRLFRNAVLHSKSRGRATEEDGADSDGDQHLR